jgi:hypothetical protein
LVIPEFNSGTRLLVAAHAELHSRNKLQCPEKKLDGFTEMHHIIGLIKDMQVPFAISQIWGFHSPLSLSLVLMESVPNTRLGSTSNFGITDQAAC